MLRSIKNHVNGGNRQDEKERANKLGIFHSSKNQLVPYNYPKACAGLNFIALASLLLLPAKTWLLQQPPSTGLETCPQVWESYLEKFAELKQLQGETIAHKFLMLPLMTHGSKALVQDLPHN